MRSKYDGNHLVSGVRFAVNSPQIVAAAGKWCDLIDQHDYGTLPNVSWLQDIHSITGLPVVLGEFSFTAADSNMPNTKGARANNPAPTQTDRTRLVCCAPHTAPQPTRFHTPFSFAPRIVWQQTVHGTARCRV